ncbi:hypothetical protein GWI33_006249 [Rhynchophorus ferrugineus]|uniref:Uncharacterized protein n=1 Tax=Rhynchophorus ferrugineus TaxID=354439 RepID=A0A834ILV4_RHYFE|nr:hypothetical protein GWI33_006249 [Rhynchophorus ferrugineus]
MEKSDGSMAVTVPFRLWPVANHRPSTDNNGNSWKIGPFPDIDTPQRSVIRPPWPTTYPNGSIDSTLGSRQKNKRPSFVRTRSGLPMIAGSDDGDNVFFFFGKPPNGGSVCPWARWNVHQIGASGNWNAMRLDPRTGKLD